MTWMNCFAGKAKYVKNLKFNGYSLDGWKCDSWEEYYDRNRRK